MDTTNWAGEELKLWAKTTVLPIGFQLLENDTLIYVKQVKRSWIESGHWCGYVRLPVQLPEEKQAIIDVHGGVTYYKEHKDGSATYGFDCAHAGDDERRWRMWQVRQEIFNMVASIRAIVAQGDN